MKFDKGPPINITITTITMIKLTISININNNKYITITNYYYYYYHYYVRFDVKRPGVDMKFDKQPGKHIFDKNKHGKHGTSIY